MSCNVLPRVSGRIKKPNNTPSKETLPNIKKEPARPIESVIEGKRATTKKP